MEEKRKMSSKAQMKEIIDRVERLLNHRTETMLRNYVRAFPDNSEQITELSMPFMNRGLTFLHDSGKNVSDFIFRVAYVKAAQAFFDSVGINASENIDLSALSSGIARFTIDEGKKHVFVIRVDGDEFNSLYSNDQAYFDYMSSGDFFLDRDLQLAYNFLRNVGHDDSAIIVVVDDAFQYTGADFSNEGKAYIQGMVTRPVLQLGNTIKDDCIEVVPFDYYFSSLRPGLAVNYFINRLKTAIDQYAVTVNNIGKLLDYDVAEVVSNVAFASNNYVGTKYDRKGIRKIQDYYSSLPKPLKITDAPYLNPSYSTMFTELATKASINLEKLEDPRLCKPLLTAEWMFNNIGDIDGFDNTYICFGYLKLVEALMAKILVEDYNGCEMSVSNTQNITISSVNEEQLMLGNMIRFVTRSEASMLRKNPFCWQITDALHKWKDDIRNGYFHKHTLDKEGVEMIRNRTFEVIYMLLGSLPK